MKSFITPDGDHQITLDADDGLWMVHERGEDFSFSFFESTDLEVCLEAVAEVLSDDQGVELSWTIDDLEPVERWWQ